MGESSVTQSAVMLNVLGGAGYEGKAIYKGLNEVLKFKGVHIHLYGKENTKPFRKMGHVTVVDGELISAKQKARAVKDILKVVA